MISLIDKTRLAILLFAIIILELGNVRFSSLIKRGETSTRPKIASPSLWDGQVAIEPTMPASPSTCRWRSVSWVPVVPVTEVCVRLPGDLVSDAVFEKGHWRDCEILVRMLEDARPLPPTAIFVDAGANIGMCTARIASLNVSTVAFEPLPANLFYLTSSLLRNPALKALVALHVVGLSEAPGAAIMYSQADNFGNSVVGQPLADNLTDAHMVAEMRKRASTVTLSTLDTELWPDPTLPPPHISLLKIDVQGFEVNAFRGAARLFAACAIKRIKSEMAFAFLKGAGTSVTHYCALLREHGFELWEETGVPLSPEMCVDGRDFDFIALLDEGECTRLHRV
jgi:FkbM family methyltransferase